VTPVVRILLAVNVLVFFLQQTLPWVTNAFVFVPQYVLLRPWTVVTYMFLHDPSGLMHIIFNMLALFFFGPRIEDRLGSGRFTTLYFLSGITGALLSFLFSFGAPILGASGAVYGVMLAFAYFWPDEPIHIWGIIPVPARLLVILTTLLTLWSGFGGARGGVAHFAHLGGYLGAFLYLKWLDRGRKKFKQKARVVEGSIPPMAMPRRPAAPPATTRKVVGGRTLDISTIHEANRAEVDRILDKIGATGLDSLTPQERRFLSNFVPLDDRMPPRT
jgi:membrane associated rhomboid family serine protease